MDLKNETATTLGETVAFHLTSSGHYCFPVNESIPAEHMWTVDLQEKDIKKRHDTLLKQCSQSVYPPKKRLIAKLKDAGIRKKL